MTGRHRIRFGLYIRGTCWSPCIQSMSSGVTRNIDRSSESPNLPTQPKASAACKDMREISDLASMAAFRCIDDIMMLIYCC